MFDAATITLKLRLFGCPSLGFLHLKGVEAARVFTAELLIEGRLHQARAQAVEHHLLNFLPLYAHAVAAFAGVEVASAAKLSGILDHVGRPAAAAFCQSRQQILWATSAFSGALADTILCQLSELSLAVAHFLPLLIGDDPQFRHIVNDPFAFWIEARDTLASLRILDEFLAVPDHPSDVELIVDDARTTKAIAVDRTGRPRIATRCSHAFGVQPLGNLSR
ncbi:hypothetical protein MNQ96_08260 [Sphingopyxis granuli]|nr:hypothetical protein [Sphingopyxis granuli]UNK81047.1 hypothetical protein MNQ96_08260 [Sphingopyxis granuli]